MSARLARNALASFRTSARSRTNSTLLARRHMSAQSHGPQPKTSDMPWLISATVVFGPLFLYLVSPSARKSHSQHAVHNDYHDFPALKKEEISSQEHPEDDAEIMKDDEGTPADVTATIALAEEGDVPKDSQSPEVRAETTIAAEKAPVGEEVAKDEESANKPTKETRITPAVTPNVSTNIKAPTATEETQA